ncbi:MULTISPECIES: hypothetical protein [unclassified Lactobacillus]|nr:MULTISPECIES: hypothetical protein [unclassified Lactobacillus]PEG91399.1 hypothetical protein CP363_02495 [Lactobacillus sp. UMNPBX12]PEG93317.1 hypothetical protein CP362_02690 [Lactobacillus sp. UMNPBX11]
MRKNLKNLGSIAFGKIPPRKVMPNIVRSIVYFILFVFLAFLEYKTEKLILWSKLFHILALLVLFVIELRAIYSYYLLITKLSAWIVDCWFKIKWSFLYPTVNDWLIVTNIENAKGARVLDLLNERGILKNTSKLYNSIKTTNKLNGFEVYSCLRRDISNLDKESILDMQFYLKNSPKTVFYEIMKMLKNAVTFLTPILIMILAYLSNSNIELSNLNIKPGFKIEVQH